MNFSEKTTDLILDIKDYSNGKIKNDFELSVLLESGYFTDKKTLFEELIFKAKFLYGMLNILSGNPDREYFEKLMPEFAGNLTEFTGLIKNIIVECDDTVLKMFSEKYFDINPEVMPRLTILITDLTACKDYFNDMKYNQV
jgi:hypothetical protein